jgi:hypothetical protein
VLISIRELLVVEIVEEAAQAPANRIVVRRVLRGARDHRALDRERVFPE